MKRWDSKVSAYCSEMEQRQLSSEHIKSTRSELNRLGNWLKLRKPQPELSEINIQDFREYMRSRSAFKAKATIYGSLSKIRGFGDYLVRQDIWPQNPSKWMKGSKIRPYHKAPKRIQESDIERLFQVAFELKGHYQRQLWSTVIAVFYGTGLRRGELERLKLISWSCEDRSLTIDGRKTGRERTIPVHQIVVDAIESYLPHRETQLNKAEKSSESLFVSCPSGERV